MRQFRALGDLRSELQARLGFGASGQAGIGNKTIIDSFLRSAHEQLANDFEWRHLDGVEERQLGADQQFIDYPSDCQPDNLTRVMLWWDGWKDLQEGLDAATTGSLRTGTPIYYHRRKQIEVWPVPAKAERIRLEYTASVSRLVDDDDRCGIPDELVLLHALANGKAHYRQPDAPAYQTQLANMLGKLKAKNRSQTVYSRTTRVDDDRMFLPATNYQP